MLEEGERNGNAKNLNEEGRKTSFLAAVGSGCPCSEIDIYRAVIGGLGWQGG